MSGVLVGIDGSVYSRKALEWAAREAGIRHAPLTVLNVHQAVAGYRACTVDYPADRALAEQARKEALKETDEVLAGLGEGLPRPAEVTVLTAGGLPAEELLAASGSAEMLVVGARGAGGFKKLLMGSVSSQVTHHSHVPVVVIPSDIR
ncbi:MAG TPA: universal stress protein [Trebonia sp.]|jgi:nucleotide-binding universal stress UspA family protein|nr:universal stress protein [Trebonia sp.]